MYQGVFQFLVVLVVLGVFQFLVVLAKKKISISKVPSYIEAFKKELKITYPGISFFTRYARVASLNGKALKPMFFSTFYASCLKGLVSVKIKQTTFIDTKFDKTSDRKEQIIK